VTDTVNGSQVGPPPHSNFATLLLSAIDCIQSRDSLLMYRGCAQRHRALLHRTARARRPLVGRLGARVHRAALHRRPGGRRLGAAEPDEHDPERTGGQRRGQLVYEERLKNWEKTGWDTRARQLQSASRTAPMRKCCAGPGRPPIARPGPRMLSTRLSPIHSHHCPYHLHPGTPEFL